MPTIREISFGCPTEQNRYNPFSEDFGDQSRLLFHGTSEARARLIIENGFRIIEQLSSSSFTRVMGLALNYACQTRDHGLRGAVLVVSFQTLNVSGISDEGECVYLYDHSVQPTVVAVCYIPEYYQHV